MITEIREWFIVGICERNFSEEQYQGSVVWGIVVHDETMRFSPGDYVCSSLIKTIIQEENRVFTNSGSTYLLLGDGNEVKIYLNEFPLLRKGFSPVEIKKIRAAGVNT
ncbi:MULTISPECIES: hypothetical protein [unclassified Pseudoalteromonas]|uniref:DUF6957 family protein n=1 Tax=unclassified Pseudoalteromonas TaxID=194690 RepID=UPI0005A839DC|nr:MULTISPECIES: hypothetical protein [unclassified Pseudoalteromonas]